MSYFKSWNTYQKFARRIMFENRYVLDSESLDFLETLAANSEDRKISIEKGRILWRAQLGNDWMEENIQRGEGDLIETLDVPTCFPPGRMKPLAKKAKEGRINPKGIPCLYLSTKKETAMSEVRPWIGAAISLSQFKVNRALTVLNLSKHHDRDPLYGLIFSDDEPKMDEHIDIVWTSVDRAFSDPVRSEDDMAGYAPTQLIAEMFRKERYDGVVYKSPFGKDGFNVALFDINSADCINGFLYEAESIEIKFKETANPYYVTPKPMSDIPEQEPDQ